MRKMAGVYIRSRSTDLVTIEFNHVYYIYVGGALVVCLPLIILCFVTVNILVRLRKRQKKKSNMQTSSTPQTSITTVLITILITFVICQSPFFIYFTFGLNIPSLEWSKCGNFMFYLSYFTKIGLLLNSSANGFIYFLMNKTFRDALCSRCKCRRNDGTESIEMATVNSRSRPGGQEQ